jgi:hypothetical protein
MKKVFSILFVAIILISGTHLTLALHFCSGEMAASRFSITGEKATCGMEIPGQTCPMHRGYNTNCCHDKLLTFCVDNFQVNDNQNIELTKSFSNGFPSHLLKSSINTGLISYNIPSVFPPGEFLPNDVDLAFIKVFRV